MRNSALPLGLLLLAATAHAETVDATLTTILQGRQNPRDGNLYSSVPLYQTMALTLEDVPLRHVADLRLVVSGWGEFQFAPVVDRAINDGNNGNAGAGDLDLGFIEGKLLDRHLEVRLGRQLVFGGAARALPLDGASVTVRLRRRVALNLYGGVPVTPRFGVHQGDFVTGSRLSFRPSVDSEVGASFVEMLKDGLQARQDVGLDARYRPTLPALRSLTFTGYALLSLLELRLVEGDLAAVWQLRAPVQLGVDYRRTSPDLFLPRSSILSVFSQETRDEAGGNVYWRPLSRLRLEGDYHVIINGADGVAGAGNAFGHRGGARISGTLGPAFETTITAEVRVLRLDNASGYVQTRIYAIQRVSKQMVATLDLDAHSLERPINGQTLSFTSAATLGWDFSPGWRAVVTAIADTTPQVERRFECMAKLVYHAVYHVRRVIH
jgi:hypothetical protein